LLKSTLKTLVNIFPIFQKSTIYAWRPSHMGWRQQTIISLS